MENKDRVFPDEPKRESQRSRIVLGSTRSNSTFAQKHPNVQIENPQIDVTVTSTVERLSNGAPLSSEGLQALTPAPILTQTTVANEEVIRLRVEKAQHQMNIAKLTGDITQFTTMISKLDHKHSKEIADELYKMSSRIFREFNPTDMLSMNTFQLRAFSDYDPTKDRQAPENILASTPYPNYINLLQNAIATNLPIPKSEIDNPRNQGRKAGSKEEIIKAIVFWAEVAKELQEKNDLFTLNIIYTKLVTQHMVSVGIADRNFDTDVLKTLKSKYPQLSSQFDEYEKFFQKMIAVNQDLMNLPKYFEKTDENVIPLQTTIYNLYMQEIDLTKAPINNAIEFFSSLWSKKMTYDEIIQDPRSNRPEISIKEASVLGSARKAQENLPFRQIDLAIKIDMLKANHIYHLIKNLETEITADPKNKKEDTANKKMELYNLYKDIITLEKGIIKNCDEMILKNPNISEKVHANVNKMYLLDRLRTHLAGQAVNQTQIKALPEFSSSNRTINEEIKLRMKTMGEVEAQIIGAKSRGELYKKIQNAMNAEEMIKVIHKEFDELRGQHEHLMHEENNITSPIDVEKFKEKLNFVKNKTDILISALVSAKKLEWNRMEDATNEHANDKRMQVDTTNKKYYQGNIKLFDKITENLQIFKSKFETSHAQSRPPSPEMKIEDSKHLHL